MKSKLFIICLLGFVLYIQCVDALTRCQKDRPAQCDANGNFKPKFCKQEMSAPHRCVCQFPKNGLRITQFLPASTKCRPDAGIKPCYYFHNLLKKHNRQNEVACDKNGNFERYQYRLTKPKGVLIKAQYSWVCVNKEHGYFLRFVNSKSENCFPDKPTAKPTQATTKKATEATTKKVTEATTKKATEATTEEATETTTEKETEATTEETTEATTRKATKATTKKATEATTKKATEATTKKAIEDDDNDDNDDDKTPPLKKCIDIRNKLKSMRNWKGYFPACDADGQFSEIQCRLKTSMTKCYCVSTTGLVLEAASGLSRQNIRRCQHMRKKTDWTSEWLNYDHYDDSDENDDDSYWYSSFWGNGNKGRGRYRWSDEDFFNDESPRGNPDNFDFAGDYGYDRIPWWFKLYMYCKGWKN